MHQLIMRKTFSETAECGVYHSWDDLLSESPLVRATRGPNSFFFPDSLVPTIERPHKTPWWYNRAEIYDNRILLVEFGVIAKELTDGN